MEGGGAWAEGGDACFVVQYHSRGHFLCFLTAGSGITFEYEKLVTRRVH